MTDMSEHSTETAETCGCGFPMSAGGPHPTYCPDYPSPFPLTRKCPACRLPMLVREDGRCRNPGCGVDYSPEGTSA